MNNIFLNTSQLFDYLENNYTDYYYRGYSNIDELKPKIGRNPGYLKHEFDMLIDFACTKEIKTLGIYSIRRLLEVGQHYGIPTRFIDWTFDPFVALFFALGKDFCNQPPIYMAFLDVEIAKQKDVNKIPDSFIAISDISQEPIYDLANLSIREFGSYNVSMKHPNLSSYLQLKMVYKKYIENLTRIDRFSFYSYEYDYENKRKESQKGVFSYHCDSNEVFPQELVNAITIILSENQKSICIDKLRNMGITKESIFPDTGIYKDILDRSLEIRDKYKE